MRDIRVAAAQFEHRNNDKAYNLARIEDAHPPSGRSREPRSSASTNARSAATRFCSISTAPSWRPWPSRCRAALRFALSRRIAREH